MKYKGLGLLAVVGTILVLAGCGGSKQPESQSKQLLQVQKRRLTHTKVKQVADNVHVLVPRTAKKQNLVQAQTYKAAALSAMKKVKGDAQSKAAYVTFSGEPTYRNFWRLTPTVRVYQRQKGDTKQVKQQKLAGINVDMTSGKTVTAASLMTGVQQLRAVNYHALAQAVAHKHYTPIQLQEARAMVFLNSMQAQNFKLAADSLTIYPTANKLNIKSVQLPMTTIAGYLNKLNKVHEPTFGNKKVVALTFDDGPNVKTTPTVLKTLKQEHVKATFFMVGYEVKANPQLARTVVKDGHEVGTHTFDHKNLAFLNPAAALAEVNTAENAMFNALGTLPTMLRPPYGAVNATHDSSIPLPSVQWAVDSQDWRVHAPAPIVSRINATVYPGSIILMHDIHPQSVAALPNVIKTLKAKGYTFVTVNQLLGKYLLPGEQYFGAGNHRPI